MKNKILNRNVMLIAVAVAAVLAAIAFRGPEPGSADEAVILNTEPVALDIL